MSSAVLDASALLCVINNEAGAAAIAGRVSGAPISAVNVAEVIAKLDERGVEPAVIDRILDGYTLRIVPFDAAQARAAGLLRSATREVGLSAGDRACLALAASLGVPALTTDRAWRSVDAGVAIELIR